MNVSVIIPTFNRKEMIVRSLGKLFVQTYASSQYEIIVVVDGSIDGTYDALRSLKSPCRLRILEQEHRGPAAARNTGSRAAETGLLLFLDDDMLCESALLAAHVATHRRHSRAVAFGALFLSADTPPSLAAECFRREIGAFHMERAQGSGIEWQIGDCVFSNTSLSRTLFEDVGGFDEAFQKREDLELGIRLLSMDVSPRYVSDAVAYQRYRKSPADLIRDAEAFAAADLLFARKHPDALIEGQLKWLAQEHQWKRLTRRIAASVPSLADFCLVPICALCEAFIQVPTFCNIGVRALQWRRRIHWLHKVLELDRSALESPLEKVL